MSEPNTTYGELLQQYPNLHEEHLLAIVPPDAQQFSLGGITIENMPVEVNEFDREILSQINADLRDDDIVPKASFGDFQANRTSDESWEISAFGLTMNDRDDVYTVGLVLVIALLVYTAKVGIDHWFNKRLERYKKKLETE